MPDIKTIQDGVRDRIAEDRPYYSGKHKRHGVNVQVLADTRGRLLWVSPALPGAVHDVRAARTHGHVYLTGCGARGPTKPEGGVTWGSAGRTPTW